MKTFTSICLVCALLAGGCDDQAEEAGDRTLECCTHALADIEVLKDILSGFISHPNEINWYQYEGEAKLICEHTDTTDLGITEKECKVCQHVVSLLDHSDIEAWMAHESSLGLEAFYSDCEWMSETINYFGS